MMQTIEISIEANYSGLQTAWRNALGDGYLGYSTYPDRVGCVVLVADLS